jgi:hypothetical protein
MEEAELIDLVYATFQLHRYQSPEAARALASPSTDVGREHDYIEKVTTCPSSTAGSWAGRSPWYSW